MKYCVVVGNPIDGLGIIGPFDSVDDSRNFAEKKFPDSNWWIVTLGDPGSV